MLMRRLLMIERIIIAGTRDFFRNAWLSLAATAVMVVTLTIMLGALVFNMALGDTLDDVTSQIDLAVFFEDSAPKESTDQFEAELKTFDNVVSTHFVSKEEALERYRRQNADNPINLAAISEEENPLPRSVEVEVKDLQKIDEIVALTQGDRFKAIVEDTSLGEDRRQTIAKIAGAKEFLLNFGVTSSLIFAGISILIIFNTIRMAIFSRGEEIQIMRLVGATNGYIRGPFLFEAMLDGIIAALISLGVVYSMLFAGGHKLVSYVNFESTLNFFQGMWPLVAIMTILGGIAIGLISSMLAMIRYLKL